MKLVTLAFPSPIDGIVALNFPERTNRYRILSLYTEFTTIVTDSNVFALVTILDGAGGRLARFTSDQTSGLQANQVTFINAMMGAVTFGMGYKQGTNYFQFGGLPPDLWITAQMRVRLEIANATPGGGSGGGTTWGGTSRMTILE